MHRRAALHGQVGQIVDPVLVPAIVGADLLARRTRLGRLRPVDQARIVELHGLVQQAEQVVHTVYEHEVARQQARHRG
ncbi:MAG: hypothetical protein U0Z44_10740 [Kouleothrix sp.]